MSLERKIFNIFHPNFFFFFTVKQRTNNFLVIFQQNSVKNINVTTQKDLVQYQINRNTINILT